MNTPPESSTSPLAEAPDPEAIAATIGRLRAEHDANEDTAAKATLLHEIGVLEEALGDEASAARDLLQAINLDADFREPLENLIAIIERRKSHKNLSKLLDRLSKVAQDPTERARALRLLAAYLQDHGDDLDGARAALEEAVQEKEDDGAAWLALEIVGGALGDEELRARALAARAGLATDEEWRSLLLIDLARLSETDDAIAALQRALDAKGTTTFAALLALEGVGKAGDRADVAAQSLEAQAALILRAGEDESMGEAFGVPRHVRTPGHAASAWLHAAEAHKHRGDLATASGLLDRAIERVPNEPALLNARLHVAEGAGDTAKSADLARALLEASAKGPSAATLWLRIAEAAAAESDGAAALDALGKGLAEDAACIPARALELDLLSGGQSPSRLAASLEETAAELATDDAKSRYYLLAADVWARQLGDAQGAKAALSQAGMYGAGAPIVARVSRMLADLTNERAWYEESTRRLLAAGALEGEQASLWFELGRMRLLRGDHRGAKEAFEKLARAPDGAWLGQVLVAYALDLAAPARTDEATSDDAVDGASAMEALAEAETDETVARAIRVVVALRHRLAGRATEALAVLSELNEADPADLVVATQLAALRRSEGDDAKAAAVLTRCAGQQSDVAVATQLRLEAGMLRWRADDRMGAIEAFTEANEEAREPSSALLSWALMAAEPNAIDARRRAIEAASDGDEGALAIERFGLEVGKDGSADDAAEALASIADDASPDLLAARSLARALWSAPDALESDRAGALASLEDYGEGGTALARASAFLAERARADVDPDRLEEAAQRWARADGALAPALEWLGTAIESGDSDREIAARRATATRLPAALGAALSASAAIVGVVNGDENQPLLDGSDATIRLANLEIAQPGADPRRRARVLGELDEALGPETTPIAVALAGFNHLAAGNHDAATAAFKRYVETNPDEALGWEGLRAAATASGDRQTLAEACAALGDAVADDARGAELWETAAFILLDELDDATRGEFALGRAVARNIDRFEPFDRLFRIVRASRDGAALLDLIDRRLDVADDPEEIAKLFWERARVLRESGDREAAMTALENVTMLEPDHVGALALSGEIYITLGKFQEAADALGRLATLDEAPNKQRLMSGVAAVDIYEKKLHDLPKAVGVLAALHDGGLSTPPVRERLARTAAKIEDWERAVGVLEELMSERDSSEGRAEAARLAMVIYRDRIEDPSRATAAVERLLQESPGDGEALDLALGGVLPASASRPLISAGRAAIVTALSANPLDAERINRLARIAAYLEDAPLRQAALGALVAVGHRTGQIDEELRTLDQRVTHTPQIAVDEGALPDLCHPDDRGPVPDLMRALAPSFAAVLGPGLEAFGVTKKDRVKPNAGLQVRNEIAAWAGALGLGDFDLYVGGPDPEAVYGVATDPVSIVIGSAVRAPLSAMHRQLVARELFALRRGATIVRHRDATDIAALVIASCKIGGFEMPSPAYAMLGEFERQLGKGLPRKVKKLLPQLAEPVARSGQDPTAWARAATASLDRLAAIASGDVSYVLSAVGGTPRGQIGPSNEAEERARRLLAFVLSPRFLELRDQLGMGVQ